MSKEVDLELAISDLLEAKGFELVVLERGGSARRPLLRLRIDRPAEGKENSKVSVSDCARVSRAVNDLLETFPARPKDYILEVSSPGLERPLVRPRDYMRFAGREVTLRGYGPISGRSRRVSGRLIGLKEQEAAVAIQVGEERLEVPLASIAKANLVYRSEDETCADSSVSKRA